MVSPALIPAAAAQLAGPPPGRTRQRPSVWLLLLFWIGCVVPLVIAIIYAVITADPAVDGGASGLSPADVQRSALVLAVSASVILILQLTAAAALTAGQPWGRVVGTVVCALWMLTCLGIPVAILGLTGLWRRSGTSRLPPPA
jgi:energy-coupling factor transporter transmembrane protein EcfT